MKKLIVAVLLLTACNAWGTEIPNDKKFIGKVYIDSLKMWGQFTLKDLEYRNNEYIDINHSKNSIGDWHILDGRHPRSKVIFYKEKGHEKCNEHSMCTRCGNYIHCCTQ